MKILVAVPYGIEKSGSLVFAQRLLRSWKDQGVDCSLIVCGRIFDADNYSAYHTLSAHEMFKRIEEVEDFDVLFWAGICYIPCEIEEQMMLSREQRVKHGKKVFLLWERAGELETLPGLGLQHTWNPEVVNVFFALNAGQARELAELSIPHEKIHLLSIGVDTSCEFSPVSSQREQQLIRKDLDWPLNGVIALYVGRLTTRKRVEFLVDVWCGDSLCNDKATLVIVGSGFDDASSTEDQIKSRVGGNRSIRLLPHQSLRAILYRGADFLVSPSLAEGEPSVVCEAMACGLPVIASAIDGHSRLVIPGKTGLLFYPESSEELRLALHSLIADEKYRLQLGIQARQMAVQNREISIVARRFLEIITAT